MPEPQSPAPPSVRRLAAATAGSLIVAAIVLAIAVLPAEYGIDPTGLGARFGLVHPPASAIDLATPVSAEAAATVAKAGTPFRSDELTLTLKPGEGAEIKATMKRGQSFVFSWTVEGGSVEFDMHGDKGDGSDEGVSYWKGEQAASGHGTFRAPFDGRHGWFWQNLTWEPVTVKVKTSGFYSAIGKL
jgi:hypothetical protein